MFLKILEAILTRPDGLDILADIVHRIVLGTPAWVYALFVALVGFGLSQTRTRSVGETAVLLLPLAMVAYSFVSVVLAFGWTLAAAAVWTAGVALALGAGTALGRARGARYVAGERRYEVAGSWVPLALILMVFFTRYCIAVAMGIDPALRQAGAFIAGASFAYGLLGGLFPARAVRVWMQRFAD
jgi:hypothetical protein